MLHAYCYDCVTNVRQCDCCCRVVAAGDSDAHRHHRCVPGLLGPTPHHQHLEATRTQSVHNGRLPCLGRLTAMTE